MKANYFKRETDTPPYANFWIRFAALLIDSFLLSVLTMFVMTIAGMPIVTDLHDIEGRLKLNLVSLFLGWFYYAGFESSKYQATPGKQLLGIFVADIHGERIPFARATGRYFAKLLSGLILLIGYIMAAFTERKQALHDLLANTIVFRHTDHS